MALALINITLILASILIALLIALVAKGQKTKPQKNNKLQNKKQIVEKIIIKEVSKEEPQIIKQKKSIKQILYPLTIPVILALLLIFETNISNCLKEYATEILPINYPSIFALISIILIAIGSLAQIKNKTFTAFTWTTHGIAIALVALIYEFLNFTHITLFNTKFSFLLTLLVISEIIFTIYISKKFKKN